MEGVNNTEKKVITILSIDGGGIRGVIPAHILGELEKQIRIADPGRIPEPRIAEYFDIVAGTSTGSLLTALLTAPDPDPNNKKRPGRDAEKFVDLYKELGPTVFNSPYTMDHIKEKLKSLTKLSLSAFNQLSLDQKRKALSSGMSSFVYWLLKFTAKIENHNIQTEVGRQLKDVKLCDTVKDVVIPSFRISRVAPVIFTTHSKHIKSCDIMLGDAVLSSAAAPSYFPPHPFTFRREKEMFFDGGLGANNPTLAALCEATHKHGNEKDYSNYLVLSLGTGQTKLSDESTTQPFSIWLFNQIKSNAGFDLIMQNANNTVDLIMSRFFHKHPQNYLRIEKYGLTKDEAEMCDGTTDHVEKLKKIAGELLSSKRVKVDPNVGTLVENGTDESYSDALTKFAQKLVAERRRREKAEGKLAVHYHVKR